MYTCCVVQPVQYSTCCVVQPVRYSTTHGMVLTTRGVQQSRQHVYGGGLPRPVVPCAGGRDGVRESLMVVVHDV